MGTDVASLPHHNFCTHSRGRPILSSGFVQ